MKNLIPKELIISVLFYFLLFGFILILNFAFPLNIKKDYSSIIIAKDSTVIHAFLNNEDKWRMFTELNEISPNLKKAIIFKEDKYFYYHFGINPFAIIRALANNILKNKRTSGASTITMQVIRLLEPKERTYKNKFIEIFRAFQLEFKYSKDEILQFYLNLVPYGGNIEGVKSASILYFDKLPNYLSIAEIVTLAIIPNRPNSLKLGENNQYIFEERNKWLNNYLKNNIFPEQDILDAINEPITAQRRDAPKMAPQFSIRMKNSFSSKNIIYTSLNIKKQSETETLVKNYITRIYNKNIKNASVLVVDNKTHQVIVYVGSSDFYNSEDDGQVDGIQAIRSPGSTLKPFLYSIAMDKGLITPKFIIADVPVSYSGYEPENYDDKFNGNVTIEFALANSLNVPAVNVLGQITSEEFVKFLIKAKFSNIEKNKSLLGLSVILGGCGVSLEQLVRLYSAFANEGVFCDLNYLKTDTSGFTKNIISKESAYMITEILTQVKRPDLPLEWENSVNLPKVAWKTGTSYGRKDAWSIGYNKNYTVGVWVGNFSSEGVPELSGSQYAAPLLFNIFNLLEINSIDEWFVTPQNLDYRTVCSESGLLPNEFCENLILDSYIPGVSSNTICYHKKNIFISPDSLISYCNSCLPENGYIKALYNNYSPEIITFFEQFNINYQKIPAHNSDCERVFAENAPTITSPISNMDYLVDKLDSTQIMLSADVSIDAQEVFWYINDKFLQTSKPSEKVFFTPPNGKVKISCSDDKARNSDIWINVKYIAF